MKEKNKAIGVFDSGVGGLTVVNELKKILPYEDIIYLGDNARAPYGSKSVERIKDISLENSLFLLQQGIKMIVVACNTASAISIPYLKEHLGVPVVGVIEGSVIAAIKATKNNRVGVIGTRQTIASEVHKNLLKEFAPNIEIFAKETPLFAPIVEEGFINAPSTKYLIEEELRYFKEQQVDTLILGCTHYPLLREQIANYMEGVSLVDPSFETAIISRSVLSTLKLHNQKAIMKDRFLVTDSSAHFKNTIRTFLCLDVLTIEKVDVEQSKIISEDRFYENNLVVQ